MGEAFLSGILKSKLCNSEDIIACNRTAEKNKKLEKKYQIKTTLQPSDLSDCDILFLGFKPQNLADITFTPKSGIVVISMLAGKKVSTIQEIFLNTKIVRIMPNVGQFVGKGTTGLFFNPQSNFTSDEKATVRSLLASGGQVLELEKETQIDWIGAISGSGPAYFFRFAEALQHAGEKLGFTPQQAESLVRQTFIGSAYLLEQNPNDTFSTWREHVTSPKGTTEQALRILNEKDLDELIEQAVNAAIKRTQELGS